MLLINDAGDPVVPPVNAEYHHERLPKSKLDIIDAGHFIWEDAADTYAALVTSWWAGGYAKSVPARTFRAASDHLARAAADIFDASQGA